jgi:hypothetical protein
MATDQAKHKQWADRQIAELVGMGVDLADAQRSVKWVLDTMPEEADPNTWIPAAAQLERDPATAESVQDARTAWYASDAVPGKFKRLLDAGEEGEE